jgi:hypothetical protein
MFKEKLEIEKYFKKLNDRNIITLCRFSGGGRILVFYPEPGARDKIY